MGEGGRRGGGGVLILDISSILEVQVIAGDINDHKMLSILAPNFETFILAYKEPFPKADLYELFSGKYEIKSKMCQQIRFLIVRVKNSIFKVTSENTHI